MGGTDVLIDRASCVTIRAERVNRVAADHEAEIVAIRRSAPSRQGRAVYRDYFDAGEVAAFCRRGYPCNGAFDRDGRLRAYVSRQDAGGVVLIRRLMGHAGDLHSGVMYLLLAASIGRAIDRNRREGPPRVDALRHVLRRQPGIAPVQEGTGLRSAPGIVAMARAGRSVMVRCSASY
ncbi:MAG: hypothetical protein GC201_10685 [Alphaproteobacteria bacterium]|nr:hypothetical protein [Alphaproteobacteria bacterium]